jgi:hypothetical protein
LQCQEIINQKKIDKEMSLSKKIFIITFSVVVFSLVIIGLRVVVDILRAKNHDFVLSINDLWQLMFFGLLGGVYIGMGWIKRLNRVK